MCGVSKANLPIGANEGATIEVHYKKCLQLCTVVGVVTEIIQYPQGVGLVIKLLQTNNSFNISPTGWSYVGLWLPTNSTAQAGFVQ